MGFTLIERFSPNLLRVIAGLEIAGLNIPDKLTEHSTDTAVNDFRTFAADISIIASDIENFLSKIDSDNCDSKSENIGYLVFLYNLINLCSNLEKLVSVIKSIEKFIDYKKRFVKSSFVDDLASKITTEKGKLPNIVANISMYQDRLTKNILGIDTGRADFLDTLLGFAMPMSDDTNLVDMNAIIEKAVGDNTMISAMNTLVKNIFRQFFDTLSDYGQGLVLKTIKCINHKESLLNAGVSTLLDKKEEKKSKAVLIEGYADYANFYDDISEEF